MFKELKDVKNQIYDLQVNYQKFFDLCTDEEKKKLDDIIKEKDRLISLQERDMESLKREINYLKKQLNYSKSKKK